MAFVSALSACVEQGTPLIIEQAQIPDHDATGGGCVVSNKRSDVHLFQGTLDVAMDRDRPYILYPLLLNSLPKMGMEGAIEPNRVNITSVSVRIEGPPGLAIAWSADCPVSFDWAAPLVLFPGDEGPLKVEILRGCHARKIREQFQSGKLDSRISSDVRFRAVVRVQGRHGGTPITSDPFEFPIRVCYGCLQTGFTDPQFVQFNFQNNKFPQCKNLSTNPYPGNACNPAQDFGPLLCCSVDGTEQTLECPGIPRGMVPSGVAPTP